MDLTAYLKRAEIPEDDIQTRGIAEIINLMVERGVTRDMAYGEFITLLYQMKRNLKGQLLLIEPDNPGHLR
jgi:hypothetical protein